MHFLQSTTSASLSDIINAFSIIQDHQKFKFFLSIIFISQTAQHKSLVKKYSHLTLSMGMHAYKAILLLITLLQTTQLEKAISCQIKEKKAFFQSLKITGQKSTVITKLMPVSSFYKRTDIFVLREPEKKT